MKLDKLTEELIAIKSVTGDENKILDFIENYLINSDFSGEIIRNNGGIIAHYPSSDSNIALVGHVDTVPFDPTQVVIDDTSKVYGRGSVDMKAGIAVMLQVLMGNFENIVCVFYTHAFKRYNLPRRGRYKVKEGVGSAFGASTLDFVL